VDTQSEVGVAEEERTGEERRGEEREAGSSWDPERTRLSWGSSALPLFQGDPGGYSPALLACHHGSLLAVVSIG
jgi:hypothetical protein